MNDDPPSTLPADLPPDINNINNGISPAEAAGSSASERAKIQIRKRFAAQTKRKAEFIHDIMFNLDILIYAEVCVLYYMEYAPCFSHPLCFLDSYILTGAVAHFSVSFSAFFSKSCS